MRLVAQYELGRQAGALLPKEKNLAEQAQLEKALGYYDKVERGKTLLGRRAQGLPSEAGDNLTLQATEDSDIRTALEFKEMRAMNTQVAQAGRTNQASAQSENKDGAQGSAPFTTNAMMAGSMPQSDKAQAPKKGLQVPAYTLSFGTAEQSKGAAETPSLGSASQRSSEQSTELDEDALLRGIFGAEEISSETKAPMHPRKRAREVAEERLKRDRLIGDLINSYSEIGEELDALQRAKPTEDTKKAIVELTAIRDHLEDVYETIGVSDEERAAILRKAGLTATAVGILSAVVFRGRGKFKARGAAAYGTMRQRAFDITNTAIRRGYVRYASDLSNKVDKRLPLEGQARQAHAIRNRYKKIARDLMIDRQEANSLEKILDFDYYVELWEGRGLTGDDVFKAIITSSTKTNKTVNKQFGITGSRAKRK